MKSDHEKRRRLAYVARRYYLDDQKQSDIAAELGISRPMVSRLLTEARQLGVVEITVHDPEVKAASLLERLRTGSSIKDGILVEDGAGDESYILEVSSPGLGRPLKKEKDFKRSMGEQVEIKLYRAVDRQKDFTGALAAYDENTVTIRYEDGSESTFDRKDIALIRLAFDF